MVALMVYLLRPGGGADFTIVVAEEGVRFSGGVPAGAQGAIEDFLTHDVEVAEAYSVRGKWDGRVLVVSVSGAGKAYEQRIRNFLKLQLKPPVGGGDE
jgi:hypothetical protein